MTIKELQDKVNSFVLAGGKLDPTHSIGARGVLLLDDAKAAGVDLEAAILTAIAQAPVPVPVPTGMKILVPAYFSPNSTNGRVYWEKLIENGRSVIAIANNNNGPGLRQETYYDSVISRMLVAGGRVIGYVYTGYGTRSFDQVAADIRKWFAFYPKLSGIFFDEVASSKQTAYYKTLVDTVKMIDGPTTTVILNTGVAGIEESLLSTGATAIVITETGGGPQFTMPSFAAKYPGHWAALTYNVDADRALYWLAHARANGVTYAYATNDSLSNPWDTIPSYFDLEVKAVSGT